MATVPITLDGRHIGDLLVRPTTDQKIAPRAVGLLAALTEWGQLGASLAALGPHRLPIAARAAAAVATGGCGVSTAEEDAIAQWFVGVVNEAIGRGGLTAAASIWLLLVCDSHAASEPRRARCPAIAEVPCPPLECMAELGFEPAVAPGYTTPDPDDEVTFLARLRAAAAGYVHSAIAGASDADILELREIVRSPDDALEDYRPWGSDFVDDAPAELLESARSLLTRRQLSNTDACTGFADWAHGFAGMVTEHAIPPVFRIGAIAWLARVALRDEERAA